MVCIYCGCICCCSKKVFSTVSKPGFYCFAAFNFVWPVHISGYRSWVTWKISKIGQLSIVAPVKGFRNSTHVLLWEKRSSSFNPCLHSPPLHALQNQTLCQLLHHSWLSFISTPGKNCCLLVLLLPLWHTHHLLFGGFFLQYIFLMRHNRDSLKVSLSFAAILISSSANEVGITNNLLLKIFGFMKFRRLHRSFKFSGSMYVQGVANWLLKFAKGTGIACIVVTQDVPLCWPPYACTPQYHEDICSRYDRTYKMH